MEVRFCWQGNGLPTVWSCGGDSCAFCHRVRGAGGGEGAVWGNLGGSIGGNTAFQREDGGEEGEMNITLLEEEKMRNRPTSARTCTSVVWAHRGAIKKAGPEKHRRRVGCSL